MRRRQQRQVLLVLETLKEAQNARCYAECQNGAIGIGKFIEDTIGEGTQTVALLEDYCELLYKASSGRVGDKVLHRQMVKIENSVRSELSPDS